MPLWRATTGAVALVACGQYFVAEAMAAWAWRAQPYGYGRNYISDLGIPCDAGSHAVCSPLAAVMNAGLVASAVLCVGAALLLAPLLAGRWRFAVPILAAIHGAGTLGVALVHSAPGTAAGTPRVHVVAAYLAVLGGNAMLIAAGWAARRSGAPRWFAAVSVGLGLLGLAGAVTLVSTGDMAPGLFERIAVDVITLWEVFAGVSLLIALSRRTGYVPILAERP